MYKLIAIDLDGTLLNSYGNVSSEDKTQVKRAVEQGVEVVLTSGRVTDSVENIAKEVGADRFLISGNGATIFDFQENKPIYDRFIERKKALQIIKLCEENSISYNLYTETTIIAKALKYNVLYYHKENLKKEENKRTKITIIDDIYNYVKNLEEPRFLKITICDSNKFVFQSIIKKLRKVNNIEVLDVSHMSRKVIKQGTEDIPIEYYYTEISQKDVDKWNAITFLAQKMNVKEEEIMAIGDNINDKNMIKNAKLGITMEGSSPDIIEIADIVTR